MRSQSNLRKLMMGIVLGAVLLFMAFPIASQDGEEDDSIIIDEAAVYSVEVQTRALTDSVPILEINGELFDGCTELGEISQEVDGDRIVINVLTERPAAAFCAQVVMPFEETIALDIAGLDAGDYQVEVNGIGADITVTQAMLDNAIALIDLNREPGICADATETTQLIEDETAEVCFLIPETYNIERFEDVPRQIIADGVADDAGQGVSLSVTLYTNSTRTIDDITEGLEASTDAVNFDWQELTIASYDAYVSDEEPGQVGHRIAFLQRENLVIEISLQPIDPLFPDATEEAEAVWELLIESFTFTADADEAETSRSD